MDGAGRRRRSQFCAADTALGLTAMPYKPELAARALEIMERLYPLVSARPEYDELLAILGEPRRWHEAHSAFNNIRTKLTLASEQDRKSSLDAMFVYVAENAAKTAYNCSGCPAPFDENSFEWLLKCESQFNETLAIQAQQGAAPKNPPSL